MITIRYPKVWIVVLTWNKIDCLEDCIKSLLKINYPNYKIIVVDNASTKGSLEQMQHDFDFIKFIRNKENLGYAGGNNVGIKFAIENGADYILLLNDDVVVDPNFLEELVNVAENEMKIGIVGPAIYYFEEPSKLYQSYGKFNPYFGICYKSLAKISKPVEVDYIYGTALLVKKEAILKAGLLDVNFFLYEEEKDWAYRIKKKGYKIVYVPSAKVYHKVSKSFSGWVNPIVLYYNTRNELLFARKHLNPLRFFPLWVPRFILRILRYALKTRDIAIVKAILSGFIDFTRNKYGNVYVSST